MTVFTGRMAFDWGGRLNTRMEERLIFSESFGWKKHCCALESYIPESVAQLSQCACRIQLLGRLRFYAPMPTDNAYFPDKKQTCLLY